MQIQYLNDLPLSQGVMKGIEELARAYTQKRRCDVDRCRRMKMTRLIERARKCRLRRKHEVELKAKAMDKLFQVIAS